MAKKQKRYNIDEVKSSAQNGWQTIHNRVCGIDDDFLNSKRHGPCPKCGGEDRWRFTDKDGNGGAICNQCGKFGDGFAVMEWYLCCSFIEAVVKVAEFLGLTATETAATETKTKNTAPPIEFLSWSDMTAIAWCHSKKAINLDALKSINARIVRHQRRIAIALPIVDQTGNPIGWTLYAADGKTLPLWDPKKKVTEELKVKIIKDK